MQKQESIARWTLNMFTCVHEWWKFCLNVFWENLFQMLIFVHGQIQEVSIQGCQNFFKEAKQRCLGAHTQSDPLFLKKLRGIPDSAKLPSLNRKFNVYHFLSQCLLQVVQQNGCKSCSWSSLRKNVIKTSQNSFKHWGVVTIYYLF